MFAPNLSLQLPKFCLDHLLLSHEESGGHTFLDLKNLVYLDSADDHLFLSADSLQWMTSLEYDRNIVIQGNHFILNHISRSGTNVLYTILHFFIVTFALVFWGRNHENVNVVIGQYFKC